MPRTAARLKSVAKSDWFNLRASNDKKSAEIDFIGVVGAKDWDGEGVTVSDFLMALRGVGDDVEDITLNIHSPGGLITEGLLMYNALAMHQATIKARILGMCGSMATVIACAADEVEMPENAVFHIHEVQGGAWGSTSDLVRAADEAEFYQAMIAKIYATKTGMSTEKCIELMQEDLPMDGPRAKELGFVDNVTDPVALSACVRFPGANVPAEALAKLPAEARALFDTSKGASGKTPSTKSNSAPPIMTEAELKAAQAKLEADQKALADSQAAALKAQTDAETLKTEAEALKASADKKLKAAKKLRAEAEEKDGEDDEEETNEDDEDGDEDGKDEDGDGDGDGKASIAKVVKAAIKAALKPIAAKVTAVETENANLKSTLKDPKLLKAFMDGNGGGGKKDDPQNKNLGGKPNPMALIAAGRQANQKSAA